MPQRIKILDPMLSSKIAAGEAIERPSSVLKELIENSVDAGATQISVTAAEGGKRLIHVVDNGEGLSREDAPLAFLRHATSKIGSEADLESIKTMGFRGEALASISSVARVRMLTRRGGDAVGTLVEIEGGGAPAVSDAGCPEGTSIEVRDLFYNLPARLKFMRSSETEFGRLLDVFKREALISPGIRFRLTHGSARCVDAPASTLKGRIIDVLGEAAGGKGSGPLMEVDSACVKGYIGGFEGAHSTSKHLYIYVNGRPVADRSVNRAVINGYGTLMGALKYPFALIDIRVPHEDVDINIHPAKSEVRFRNQRFIYDAVNSAIRAALARAGGNAAYPVQGADASSGEPGRALHAREHVEPWRGAASTPEAAGREPSRALADQGRLSFKPHGKGTINAEFLDLRFIGQLWGEFIVAESSREDGVFYIIDAHGAAERCAFERLKAQLAANGIRSQRLLIPERVETTPDEKAALMESIDGLKRLGFELEPFGLSVKSGGETFLIRSVPEVMRPHSVSGLIKDLAGEMSAHGGSPRAEERIDDALMRIACHGVIRGPRPLAREEYDALMLELSRVDFAGHCPHGRPVVRRISRKEVEEMFKR